MWNIYKNAFIWGFINNFSIIVFGFLLYVMLGETLTIDDFAKFILLFGTINVAFAFTEFRLQDVILKDFNKKTDDLQDLFIQLFIAENALRLFLLIILTYPILYFLDLNFLEYLFFSFSLIISKIYIGVTSGFTKLSKTSFKLGLLILIDVLPKLYYVLVTDNLSFATLSVVYATNSLATLFLFLSFYRSYFKWFGYKSILTRFNNSRRFIYDNWRLSVSQIGLKELDILIVGIFYSPTVVITFRYAKLFSAAVWRLIDSSMQIELMRRNIENDNNRQIIYTYRSLLTLYAVFLPFTIYFSINILQNKEILFTKLDDLNIYFISSSIWLLFAVHNYKSISSLQFKDEVGYLIISLFISTTLYLVLAIFGRTLSVLSLPISYSICMSTYFILSTYFNSKVPSQ